MLQTQRARRDAPGAARHGRILVASLDERKQILGSVRPPLRTPLSPSGALDHRGLWTPRRSAAAAAGSDGPLPSPQVPKTARPSLFSSPGRAADRAGPTGPTARTPALPNIRTPRSFSHTMPRPSRRPFFPGAEPSPRRLVYSESSDDDSRPGGVVLHGSRPTSSEGQSRLTTPGVVVGELSSSLQSSWGFASMHSFGFSDGEDDEAPSIKRRTSTASLESGRRLASSKGKRQPARTGEESRLTSAWSQGDALVNWSLILARQNLKQVPDYVFRRTNLRDLQLTGNALTKIPKDIARLEQLNVLKLDENQLDGLPTELALLNCLQILDVSANQILDLDDQFVLPRNLLEARFSNNKIRQLPHFFFIMSNFLQVLDLSVNELELLPASPWKELPNLQSIDLRDNRIRKLPAEMLRMPNLCKLDVSDNQLVDLQIGLSDLELVSEPKAKSVHSTYEITTTLLSIECSLNDSLLVPPREVIASGGQRVAMYLQQFVRAQKRKSLEENVALLQKERERIRGHAIEPLPSVALAAINEEHGEATELQNAQINVSTPDSIVPSQLTHHDPQVQELSADLPQDLLEEAERQLETMGEPEANDLEFNKSLRLVAIGTNEPSLSTLLDLLNRVCSSNTSEYGRCRWVFRESSEGCLENHGSELSLKVDRIRRELLHPPSSSNGRECGQASFKTLKSLSDQHQLQHLWKTHRAVFLLAWRIYPDVKDGSLNDLEISAAVHTIQMVRNNCPHAQIFVVPTVLKETSMVKVKDLIAQLRQGLSEHDHARLQFFEGGAICTEQDCKQPERMEKLKANLRAWAMTSPFYNELLPTYVLSLHDILSDRLRNGSLFITWEEYSSLARSSGVPSSVEDLRIATAMLQDMGALRYFGYDVLQAGNHSTRLSVCLKSTVFLSWDWMMEVMERIVDVDTTKMITYFSDCDSSLALLASMLVSDGILHSRLLPFIWPCLDASEEWPGVDSEMIVSFWEHFKNDSSNRAACYSQARIGTERATLERAYAVLIGFHFALVDANEVLYDELEQISGRLHRLKYFNKSFKCSLAEHDVGVSPHVMDPHSDMKSRTFMPTIVVPSLSIRPRKRNGNDDTNLPATFETRHVHFPGPDCHFHALAIYEVVTITLGSESDLQPLSQSSPCARTASLGGPAVAGTAKQSVYDFTSSTYARAPQEVHGKQVDVSLRRTLQISLKRHGKESPLYIGCAAILDLPDPEKAPLLSASQKAISDALERIPSALISSSSVRAVHHLILYRAPVSSSMIGQSLAHGTDKLVEVSVAIGYAKLLEARKEFERHLFYLLLSHLEGVVLVKSLIDGDSRPCDFFKSIEKLYFENVSVTSESELGPAINGLQDYLVSLDISNNPALKKIPSKELCSITSLKYLECVGSPKVRAIPPEVAKLGGVQTLEYMQSAASESEENKELQIIVLGSGEAGKSSLINCITSADNTSVQIHEDARTVGIEIRTWKPAAFEMDETSLLYQPNRPRSVPHKVEPDGLRCHFLDLAGQAVYGSSNQFFLVPRALYVVAWRVLEPSKHDNNAKMQELSKMIVSWLDSLQVRVPGCSIVMVATHIDAAAPSSHGDMSKASKAEWTEIDLQCAYVQKIVSDTLRRIRHEANKSGVTPLEVYAHGQSLKVQCLEGFGIKNLRRTLIELAHSLPSWRELIPKSYNQLRLKIEELGEQKTDPKVWLTWEDYANLAKNFNVTGRNLAIATTFLNDMAVIKYFGTVTPEGHPEDEKDVLDNTVFTSPAWIIDGLKGLIRHDRDILIEYCHSAQSEANRVMLRRVNRLVLHGTCDSKLVPFLWPGGPGTDSSSQKYWNWLKENQKKDELRLWPGLTNGLPFARSEDDYKRVIALLTGCDFVYKHIFKTAPEEGEYVAPVLLTHDNSLDARSLEADCQIKHEYHITGIAAGFFDRLLVRAQQGYSHVEHSKTAGVYYGRGLKAQIFLVLHPSASAENSNKVMKSSAASVARMPRSSITPSRRNAKCGAGIWPTEKARLYSLAGAQVCTNRPTGKYSATTGASGANICTACGVGTYSTTVGASASNTCIKCGKHSGLTAPGASMLRYFDEDTPEDSADPDHVHSVLTVLTSTRRQQVYIAKAIRDLHDFFPGMSIGPYPSEAMLFANRELAKMEPVHIRIAALSPEKAEKVKKLLLDADKELDQAHERQRSKCRFQLRIDAGAVDLERGEGEEKNSEKYMDFESRVVLVCMEKFGNVGRDLKEVGNLEHRLTTYEKKYGCVGRILDENLLSALKMHLSDTMNLQDALQKKMEKKEAQCKHKRPRGLCEDCCSDEAFALFKDMRQYDAARQKLCEAVLVREFRLENCTRQRLKWSSEHKGLIDSLQKEVNQQIRAQTNSQALEFLHKEEAVLVQIALAETNLRLLNDDAERFVSTHDFFDRIYDLEEREKMIDWREKVSHYHRKYYLLWAQLEVLHALWRITVHTPEVDHAIGKLVAAQYGISDMRRAHDALKGQQQKADILQGNLHTKKAQLDEIMNMADRLEKLETDCKSELDWTTYLDEFEWHVRKRRTIIPLIMPGYFEDLKEHTGKVDYSKWWPDRMKAMEDHALFVKLSDDPNFDPQRTLEQVKLDEARKHGDLDKLIGQIETDLERWRGKPPDDSIFDPPDLLPCYLCLQEQAKHPHRFSRAVCEQEVARLHKEQLSRQADCDGEKHSGQDDETTMLCEVNPEHRLSAAELLSTGVIYEAVPCPQCVQNEDLPPHTFNRKKCVEWFSDANDQKIGSMSCPRCKAKKRVSQFRIVDLVAPQVFFSYNWGKQKQNGAWSTQEYITPLRRRMELQADLLVWQDVCGGMGFGDNHKVEMLEGIKKATVVVIFLSDAYVNSPNCQREYLHAVRNSKFIVPVLVPPDNDDRCSDPADPQYWKIGANSGWTGEYDANNHRRHWWQHIFKVIRRTPDGVLGPLKNDPDQPSNMIDWSVLGRFEPIDMRNAETAFDADSPQEKILIKRIQSRFHRPHHIDHGTRKKYAMWREYQEKMAGLLSSFKNDDVSSLTMEKVERVFQKIDTDGSGEIDEAEIVQFFKTCNASVEPATAAALMREADHDGTGKIDKHEFMGLITELVLSKSTATQGPGGIAHRPFSKQAR